VPGADLIPAHFQMASTLVVTVKAESLQSLAVGRILSEESTGACPGRTDPPPPPRTVSWGYWSTPVRNATPGTTSRSSNRAAGGTSATPPPSDRGPTDVEATPSPTPTFLVHRWLGRYHHIRRPNRRVHDDLLGVPYTHPCTDQRAGLLQLHTIVFWYHT